jgi:hypothetical protein
MLFVLFVLELCCSKSYYFVLLFKRMLFLFFFLWLNNIRANFGVIDVIFV